ncbi:MAG: SPOR domain-containing protein [Candidatus Lambdaproteobacteria bacterium]|nr:SPOR domain-containing protein [Candidatus Lambdaproteobacteria bacterium]
MAKAKKKGGGGFYLWGGLGVLVLTAGVVLAAYFIQKSQFPPNHRLRIIQDFMTKFSSKIDEGVTRLPSMPQLRERFGGKPSPGQAPPAGPQAPGGPRSHVVTEGENLWHIAKQGTLVDNAYEWRTILAQNRDKVDYAFVSAGQGGWKVLMEPGRELVVRQGADEPLPAELPRKWALQVASLTDKQQALAVRIVGALLQDGHFAYTYRTEVDGKYWYRIRAGFFESSAQAKAAGRAIRQKYARQQLFTDEFWVLKPRVDEMRGERIDYGAQNVRPYVIDFPVRGTHAEALEDFRKLAAGNDFVYISQLYDPVTAAYTYRTRIGYFATEAEAQRAGAAHAAQGDGIWKGSRVMAVENFVEAMPGQTLRLHKVKR